VGHAVLGELVFDHERESWISRIDTSSGPIVFEIGGERMPDEGLMRHAVDLAEHPAQFMAMVTAFLEVEAKRHKRVSDEIRQLKLESVCLWWPKRPDDGMLYFAGPNEHRVWRCDYVKRTPRDLGFDS
jgi:hypothetical protein